MKSALMIVASVAMLASVGLWAWTWLAMAQAEDDLRSLDGFEGLHLDR